MTLNMTTTSMMTFSIMDLFVTLYKRHDMSIKCCIFVLLC